MFLARNQNWCALYSIICNREVANQLNPRLLVDNIVREFRARGVNVMTGPRMTYALLTEVSQIGENRFSWDCMVKFSSQNELDSTIVDDWFAYCWNLTIGTTNRMPSDNPSRGGALLSRCSRYETLNQSSPLSVINPLQGFFGGIKYQQVCSQYQRIAGNPAEYSISGTGSIADRLMSTPVISASSPELIGTNPQGSTDIQDMLSDTWSSIARSVNSAFGAESGEGLGTNDVKFFAYSALAIVGALVLVKVVKEVKSV